MELYLSINYLDITLGMPLDLATLKAHKFKKPGLLSGIKKQPGQIIIWSKNCEIGCLENKFVLFPNLDANSGRDLMHGTSAYLFFTNKILEYLTFQTVGNKYVAEVYVAKFREIATNLYGQPTFEGNMTIWGDMESNIVIEKLPDSPHGHFHWALNK
jgi:hypothetical protein